MDKEKQLGERFFISEKIGILTTFNTIHSDLQFHVDLMVLSIFQKAVTFDHNLTPYT